jgi:hypothetical protein
MAKEAEKEAFTEALEMNLANIKLTCAKVGISRRTYYDWFEDDKEFAERCIEVTEGLIDLAETALLGKIKEGDTTALIFFLKTKGKHRGYTERTEVDVNIHESLTERTVFRVKSKSLEDAEMIKIEAK